MPRLHIITWSVATAFLFGLCAGPVMSDTDKTATGDNAAETSAVSDQTPSEEVAWENDPRDPFSPEPEAVLESVIIEETDPSDEVNTTEDAQMPSDLILREDDELDFTKMTPISYAVEDQMITVVTEMMNDDVNWDTVDSGLSDTATEEEVVIAEEDGEITTTETDDDSTAVEPVTEETTTQTETTQEIEAEEPVPVRKVLTDKQVQLRNFLRYTINGYYKNPTNTRDNTAADILQNMLAFGRGTNILYITRTGDYDSLNVMRLLGVNYPSGGYSCLRVVDGRIAPRNGYGAQTVPGQVAAVFAQAGIPLDQNLKVGSVTGTVADLIEHEKLTCRDGKEQSMKLIALACYLEEENWINDQGEEWSIERMIEQELNNPLAEASGNGMDRLVAMAYVIIRAQDRDIPLTGQYEEARIYLEKSKAFALKHQGRNGTWNSRFAMGPGEKKLTLGSLKATGRMLEWLALSMTAEELESPAMQNAVQRTAELLGGTSSQYEMRDMCPRDIEGLTHALRALMIYDKRVFRPADDPEALQAARKAAGMHR